MNNEELVVLIEDLCSDNCYDFRNDYSGRGMYGKKCVGIVCSKPLKVILELTDRIRYLILNYASFDELEDKIDYDIIDIIGTPEIDSMGLDMIVYFPKITIEE